MKTRLSNWKEESDLYEVVTGKMMDKEALKKVDEKKGINNKVVINPKLSEAIDDIGGEVLAVNEALAPSRQELQIMKKVNRLQLRLQKEKRRTTKEAEKAQKDNEDVKVQQEEVGLSSSAQMAKARKEAELRKKEEEAVKKEKKALKKEEFEAVVEYFYTEGINEEGLDLIIEEVGLDDFVDFVDDSAELLTEERAARKMNVRTLKATKKKAEEIKASKKDVVARSTPKDVLSRARTERSFKKPKLSKAASTIKKAKKDYDGDGKKETPKQEHRGVRNKKITQAVKKVKPAQPKKPASKEGIRAKVKSAYEAGVKRHRKATQPIRVFHKGMKKAPKAVAKAAVDVKRAIAPRKESYDPMEDPDFDHDEAEKNRGVSGKNNPKGGKKLKDILKKVQEGKLTSVKATTYGMPPEERKAHIDAERKRQGVKPKPEKKIEEEVGISSTEKMAAARKEAKIRAKEAAAVKKAKSDKQKAAARKKSVNANKQLSSSELKKYDTDGDGKIRVVNASFSNWKKELIEKDLNAKERRALPDKEFALPGKGKGPEGKQAGSYPIPDENHARMALAMVAKHGTPEKKAQVRAAVAKKFPGIQQEAASYETVKKGEVLSALKRDNPTKKKPLSVKDRDKIADKVVRDKGDTSKSDDRYAYESLQQEGLVGAKVDSQKEVNRATRKAAFRPFKNTTPPKLKVAEDRAFDNIVSRIRESATNPKKFDLEKWKEGMRKKEGAVFHGDPGTESKKQPKPKPKKDTRTPEQKKADQEKANIDAVYGRTLWNKKGSLGT